MKFGLLSLIMLRGSNDSCVRLPEEKMQRLREVGIQVIKRKDYEQAIKCYSALIQLYEGLPGQETAWYRMQCGITLAECHMNLGNTEEAIARFSDVIDEFPPIDTIIHHDESGDVHSKHYEGRIYGVDRYKTKEKYNERGHVSMIANDECIHHDEETEMLRYSIGEFIFYTVHDLIDLSFTMYCGKLGETYCKRAIAFQSLGLSKFSLFDLNVAIEHSPYDERKFVLLDQAKEDAGK